MSRRRVWLVMAVLLATAVTSTVVFLARRARPLSDEEVFRAWREAGLTKEWYVEARNWNRPYYQYHPKPDGLTGALPAFRLRNAQDLQRLARLPEPNTPFALDFRKVQGTDTDFRALHRFKRLTVIGLRHSQLTDGALLALQEGRLIHALSELDSYDVAVGSGSAPNSATKSVGFRPASDEEVVSLNLARTPVTDAGLIALRGLPNLTDLNLANTKVTAEGLKELAGLGKLTKLDLSGTKVTDAGLKELAGLGKLSNLNLSSTKVTDGGMKVVARHHQLTELMLGGTQVTAAGLKELVKGVPRLNSLWLDDSQVTDAALDTLAEVGRLHVLHRATGKDSLPRPTREDEVIGLDLSNTEVTNGCLWRLEGLKNLRRLDVRGTKVTPFGAKDLQKYLPKCSIEVGRWR